MTIEQKKEKPKNKSRPNCPVCGDANPFSNGPTWRCRICGKAWVKVSSPRVKIPSPPCIYCSSTNTASHGKIRWICIDCGRFWRKVVTEKTPINSNLFTAKVIEI
ncbi:hypothetical protein A2Z67_00170 [Candidatus Woesebacteria bacterium RBG_13_36_22]|uniref:Uncharacterized protein n=1 Tax=Candidatus Woesebacteria bacterium RBG_13_36_22 TaxID=1802478 RepID=A0A1F7X3F1_9BACT|nr:MAG: hypothetical protein A2Z67_00170 [Candidatus Woesebacteria bacterium RBG_13_36_22]